MENVVYVVLDRDSLLIGVYRTLESAKKSALEEIEEYCDRFECTDSEKSSYISQLNDELYVEDIVYISPETLYD